MKFFIAILSVFFSCRVAAEDPVKSEAREDLAALHTAMARYLKENGKIWPQLEGKRLVTGKQISKFWRETLKPYGAKAEHWEHSEDPLGAEMSYLPTAFNGKKDEAYRLKGQPWFVQTFRSDAGMWLVCRDGTPKKFESEAREDLAVLHSAMAKYLKKNGGIWPQIDSEVYKSEQSFVKFWADILRPYGAEKKHWVHSGKPSGSGMDYSPAIFDSKKDVAFRWEKQPWFMQSSREPAGGWLVFRDGEPRIHSAGKVPSKSSGQDSDQEKSGAGK